MAHYWRSNGWLASVLVSALLLNTAVPQVPDLPGRGQGRPHRGGGEGCGPGRPRGLQDHLGAAQHAGEPREGAPRVRRARPAQARARMVPAREHAARPRHPGRHRRAAQGEGRWQLLLLDFYIEKCIVLTN